MKLIARVMTKKEMYFVLVEKGYYKWLAVVCHYSFRLFLVNLWGKNGIDDASRQMRSIEVGRERERNFSLSLSLSLSLSIQLSLSSSNNLQGEYVIDY